VRRVNAGPTEKFDTKIARIGFSNRPAGVGDYGVSSVVPAVRPHAGLGESFSKV
jgi:hypothetical protein